MDQLESLTKTQLREKCKAYGLPNVPITDTTQKVVIEKLRVVMKNSRSAKGALRAQFDESSSNSPALHTRRTIAAPSAQTNIAKGHRSLRRRTVLLDNSAGSESEYFHESPRRTLTQNKLDYHYRIDDSDFSRLYRDSFKQQECNQFPYGHGGQYASGVGSPRLLGNNADAMQTSHTSYGSNLLSNLANAQVHPKRTVTSATNSYFASASNFGKFEKFNRNGTAPAHFTPRATYKCLTSYDQGKPLDSRTVSIGRRNEATPSKVNSLYPTLESCSNREEQSDSSQDGSEEFVTYPRIEATRFSNSIQPRNLGTPQARRSLRSEKAVLHHCVKDAFLRFMAELQHHYHIKEIVVIIFAFAITLFVCVLIWG